MAENTARREAESAASNGTRTSHSATGDAMPPDSIAASTIAAASEAPETMCAVSSRPVCERKHAAPRGAIAAPNSISSNASAPPRTAR